MSDRLSREKRAIIKQAQDMAEERLSGDTRFTEVTLWDDGDFKVAVIYGREGFREKIVYRSNESDLYPGECFIHEVETIDVAQVGTTIKQEIL